MNALLDQLGLDNSFFLELAIIAVIFFFLANFYFRPFLKLFEFRHKRTIEDREAAERLMTQAQAKLEEYKRLLSEERLAAKKDYDLALQEVRKLEAELMAQAREEAKQITQAAADSVNQQREELKRHLDTDIESIAQSLSERLLSRKI